jgi:hypothetical protein
MLNRRTFCGLLGAANIAAAIAIITEPASARGRRRRCVPAVQPAPAPAPTPTLADSVPPGFSPLLRLRRKIGDKISRLVIFRRGNELKLYMDGREVKAIGTERMYTSLSRGDLGGWEQDE